jgi:hypothetical protein
MNFTNTFVHSAFVLDETVALSIYYCKEFATYGMIAFDTEGSLLNWGGFTLANSKDGKGNKFSSTSDLFAHMVAVGRDAVKDQLAYRAHQRELASVEWTLESRRAHMIERMQNEG